MWWMFPKDDENTVVEIDLKKFQNFIFQEALFIEKIEQKANEVFAMPNILSGKSFFLWMQLAGETLTHMLGIVNYFNPEQRKV
jgi:hypothetical protein